MKLLKEEIQRNKLSNTLAVQNTYKFAREALQKLDGVYEWSDMSYLGIEIKSRRSQILWAIPNIKDNPFGMRARIYSSSTFHDKNGNLVY